MAECTNESTRINYRAFLEEKHSLVSDGISKECEHNCALLTKKFNPEFLGGINLL